MKRPKFKKSSEDEVKEVCRAVYPFLRQVYRRLSAYGVSGIILAVGWNTFREFMTQTIAITDKTNLKPEDVDRLFIAVNSGGQKKTAMNPDKALVRFEMLEIMLRSAIKKYCEGGELEGEAQAVEALWSSFL